MLLFFLPSACITLFCLLLLLALKTLFKNVLPSYSNIIIAHSAFIALCVGIYVENLLISYFHDPVALWVGRILGLCGLILFIKVFCQGIALEDIGICRPSPKEIPMTILLFFIVSAVTWYAVHRLSPHKEFSTNTFLFMLLIAGLGEELVFRGLMPSLLMVRVGPGRQLEKINRILVFVIPTAFFSLIHAWRFMGGYFYFSGYTFCMIGVGACAFMYLRLKTNSLINSMLVHNLLNAGTVVVLSIS